MGYAMGIDIGTYESKGVIVNHKGEIIAQSSIPHKLEVLKQGWAEHDADHTWWSDFCFLSHTLLKKIDEHNGIKPAEIEAVGVSSIAPAVVPINMGGKPLRKAILYGVDTRAKTQIEYLNEKIGQKEILNLSGQTLSSQSAGPKILWIRQEEPDIYQQTYKFLSGSGYIVYKLTDEYVIDYYTAASYSPLFNLQKLEWDSNGLKYVTEIDKMPSLKWSHEIVGTVTSSASIATGLAIGTKVIAGTADALSESISVGAVEPGDLMLMYGSSTFFILVTDKLSKTTVLWPNIHSVDNLFTITGGTATAGSLTRWFVDQLMSTNNKNFQNGNQVSLNEIYSYISTNAEKSPPGANGLITLPYFSGERTPIHDSDAKGVFFGLTLFHTQGDIYRSILEGISFSIKHNLDEIKTLNNKINRIIAVGGGVKSNLWLQAVSDICQIEQTVPKVTIGASYGNTFLCSLALGWNQKISDIKKWVSTDRVITPIKDNYEVYENLYDIYRRLYLQNKDLMKELK